MKRSTLFAKPIITLISLLTLSVAASASAPTNTIPPGGTRGLIQLKTEVRITQATSENLSITVLDVDGTVVAAYTTDKIEATFSTRNLEAGEYTVQTIDDDSDYEEHTIIVD